MTRENPYPRRAAGIVGLGVVGSAMAAALEAAEVDVVARDRAEPWTPFQTLGPEDPIFVCVGTEYVEGAGLDVSEVVAVTATARQVAPAAPIVVRSTVPPGTTAALAAEYAPVMCSPEFLVAADPAGSLRNADRHVIGAYDRNLARWAVEPLLRRLAPAAPVLVTDPTVAELAKLSSNALLAAKVAMANQLDAVARAHHVPWDTVRAAVGLDRRIGPDHLEVRDPPGFGGSCLPKDLAGLADASAGANVDLLRAVYDYNDRIRWGER